MAEISVVVPIYNGEQYLEEALNSIALQSFKDFEVILVCEYGTSNESLDIVHKFRKNDKRFKIITNTSKLGISESLNVGIRKSTGKYIARMDGDDISCQKRLEIQKLYMDYCSNIGVCGIIHKVINSPRWIVDYHSNPEQINSDLLFFVPLKHPTIMIRSDVIYKNNLFYDSSLPGVEDYDYFIRASKVTELTNINEPDLFYYRRTSENASLINEKRDEKIRKSLIKSQFYDRLKLDFSDKTIDILDVVDGIPFYNEKIYLNILSELQKNMEIIMQRNNEMGIYRPECLINTMEHRWFRVKYSMDIASKAKLSDKIIDKWRAGDYYNIWMDR